MPSITWTRNEFVPNRSRGRQQLPNWLLEAPTIRGAHAYQKELSRVPPRSSCISARRRIMAKQIVMDATGDTQHEFNPTDAAALKEAERRFKELTGAGFIAAGRTSVGQWEFIRNFNPAAEETVFFPRLKGG